MNAMTFAPCRLTVATAADVAILAPYMRPDEQAQMVALHGWAGFDPDAAARSIIAGMGSDCWALIGADRLPIAVGGFLPVRIGVLECWAIGTLEGWDRHWRSITKHCKREIRAALSTSAHRVQTVALASREAAHAWYRDGLGLQEEGRHAGFFANGEDGISFAITRRTG